MSVNGISDQALVTSVIEAPGVMDWIEKNQPEWDWLVANVGRTPLARTMLASLGKHGNLTGRQRHMIRKEGGLL